MPNWTSDQLSAIKLRDKNLLVSAAAGSGKTAVLVERIIRIITEDKIDIDRLLIVTFTNAAAGEMRERILDALTKKLEEDGEDEYIRKQISLLNKASITTLHSFCRDVVKRNFHLVDIDPKFRIGDETELSIIRQEVLDEILEKEYEKENEYFIKLVEGYGRDKEDIKLRELILKIYYFIQSKPYPERWLEESIEMFNVEKEELEKSKWIKTIKDILYIELDGAKHMINNAIETCKKINGPVEYLDALYDDMQNIDSLEKGLSNSLQNFFDEINGIKHKKLKSIKGDRKLEVSEENKEKVKKLRNDYKKIIDSIKNKMITNDIESNARYLKEIYPIMKYLYRIVIDFGEMYRNRKLERGILDFNDLEHYTLKILENEDIQREYQNKFRYIFVDEYQDSNIVQETILNCIKRDDNLFLVGDVKQSIYRFRLADPSLFIEKYNTFSKNIEDVNVRIDLSKNFRSRQEILEGVNYIFKKIMSSKLGEIDYTEDAYLYKGLDFGEIWDSSIEIDIVEKDTSELDIDEELEELTDIEVEANIIVSKIKELIGKKTYDPKKQEFRDIMYKDIVILLRTTKNWASIFTEVLLKEGIPVYSDDNTGYFESLEIKIFINLLKLIDNKRQDLLLLSVMRSSIANFSIDDLIAIRVNKREGAFYNALEEYIDTKDDELKHRLVKFIEKLDKWAEESKFMKLDEFIWKLLRETNFYYFVGSMPGGKQRQANLRILVDRASQFEKTSINGLFNFIRFIDKLTKSSGDMSAAKTIGENENVVRIMSIHKSKGLEFPVVICAGLGKKFNLMDTREDILLHKDLGLGPKFIDLDKRIYIETLPLIAIREKMKLESLSEEMRILYVALTRAIDKLILLGSVKNINNRSLKWCDGASLYNLTKSNCYLDWIMSALSEHRDGILIHQLAGLETDENTLDSHNSKWKINIIDRSSILMEKNDELMKRKEILKRLKYFKLEKSSEYRDIINLRFNWEYKQAEAVEIPSKLSVTDIKNLSFKNIKNAVVKTPSLIKKPRFLESKKGFTRAEKGTIMHFMMQHLSFNDNMSEQYIKQQIDDMVERKLLTEEEAKVIDISKILNFFKSSIGQRIISAEKLYKEVPFVLRKKAKEIIKDVNGCDEELLIQGVIDCYFEEGNEFVLVDYKTDFVYGGYLENIVKKYKVQLELYKEALEKITGKKVKESYLYLFDLNKEVRVI
ncbi:helicase-exonuclease AddAB subunit AddA [Caloranaerobacter azorensis]|uniref:ATP-dependent helicase/nuclease subunit A n=1 Tax=Caloranaerobacter azorensis TaxID=116090 RepID=A0A6P1YAZ0_9FIRM|nr:helicase-exonuclease AddAB subunit AddA [Caloranaerobacter azorensis]QIB26361.1 helicase-exonuclease AddAB subunit AddA [Caloranaerobacter azorensis]